MKFGLSSLILVGIVSCNATRIYYKYHAQEITAMEWAKFQSEYTYRPVLTKATATINGRSVTWYGGQIAVGISNNPNGEDIVQPNQLRMFYGDGEWVTKDEANRIVRSIDRVA